MHIKPYYLEQFKSLSNQNRLPKPLRTAALLVLFFIVATSAVLIFVPWVQTASGFGQVTSFYPEQRPQTMTSMVDGRIANWFVREGDMVNKDQPIVEITDNDPNYLQRLALERDAKKQKLAMMESAVETVLIDRERKKKLFEQGLVSRKDYELSQIKYKDYQAKMAVATAELAQAEVKNARQMAQIVRAPGHGIITQIRSGDAATFVKKGDNLAQFTPVAVEPVVELFLSGIDIPLVHIGDKARIQFEGWPAIPFSGWPYASIGTFGGVVKSIDPSVSVNGKFRVLITPDHTDSWPDQNFLRYGTKIQSWVLMRRVRLGYEIWRKVNGFPLQPHQPPHIQSKTGSYATQNSEKGT